MTPNQKKARNQIKAKLLEWKNDARLFVEEAFGIDELEDWQDEYLRCLPSEDRISIRSGHGVGKTAALAWTIIWYLLTAYPCKIACTAPSEHQLNDILWAELAKWKEKLVPPLNVLLEMNNDMIYVRGSRWTSFAVARVARPERPESFQGFHSEHMMLIADEASGVADAIFETAMGAMTTGHTKMILTGNPTKTFGFFYKTFHEGRAQYRTFRVSSLDIKRKGTSKTYADEIAAMYGRQSNMYRVRVLGEFPLQSNNAVVPLYLIEAAVNRQNVEPIHEFYPVWGLDVARKGTNRTALAKRCGNVMLEPVKWWTGMDTVEVVSLLRDEYDSTPDEMKPREIVVDTIGLGAGVYDVARRSGLPVIGLMVSERPSVYEKGERRFNKLRDEMYWRVREWFEDRTCIIPDDSNLISELSVIEYDFTGADLLIKIEGKDDIVKKLEDEYKSPDLADAFMLTFAGGRKRRGEPLKGSRKRYGSSMGYRRSRSDEASGWAA